MAIFNTCRTTVRRPINIIRQTGSALLTALFVMVVAVSISVVLLVKNQSEIYRTQQIIAYDQLFYDAQIVHSWAIGQLLVMYKTAKDKEPVADLSQAWAQPFEATLSNGAIVGGSVQDWHSRFDLNHFYKVNQQNYALLESIFVRLLQSEELKLDLSADKAKAITRALYDWVNEKPADSDSGYRALKAPDYPYVAAHMPMSSISEFRLLRGVSPLIFERMQPYIGATRPSFASENQLTGGATLNPNTASPMVLAAVLDLKEGDMLSILDKRPFTKMADFEAALDLVSRPEIDWDKLSKLFSLQSAYFLSQAQVQHDGRALMLNTLLERKEGDVVMIHWQSRGAY